MEEIMASKTRQEETFAKKRFWKAHIQAWNKSGLSQNDYCRRNKLKIKNFWYWKNKFSNNCDSDAVNFVSVPVVQEKTLEISRADFSGLTICINGFEIRVNNDFSSTTLTNVIDILGG
jgi:hypothetical protein